MAIVKVKAGKGSLSDVFNYVLDREKTEAHLIAGKDCMTETAQKEFEMTKLRFGKTDGRTYFHIVQSFSPEDDLDPYVANNLGYEFAHFFEGYQVLVVTHTNREHLHNHIIGAPIGGRVNPLASGRREVSCLWSTANLDGETQRGQ